MNRLPLELVDLDLFCRACIVIMIEAHDLWGFSPSKVAHFYLLEILQPSQSLHQNQVLVDKDAAHFCQHDKADQLLLDCEGVVRQISRCIGFIGDVPKVSEDIPQLLFMAVGHEIAIVVLSDEVEVVAADFKIFSKIADKNLCQVRLSRDVLLNVHPHSFWKVSCFHLLYVISNMGAILLLIQL